MVPTTTWPSRSSTVPAGVPPADVTFTATLPAFPYVIGAAVPVTVVDAFTTVTVTVPELDPNDVHAQVGQRQDVLADRQGVDGDGDGASTVGQGRGARHHLAVTQLHGASRRAAR